MQADESTISFWISGQPPRKSNNRRIVYFACGPRIIKSDVALAWVKSALWQIPARARVGWGSLEEPLSVTMFCYYETRRPDLSGELVLDVLQEAGVIADDRYVYELHLHKHFSKREPGVRVSVRRL